jgi:hypothetical protein
MKRRILISAIVVALLLISLTFVLPLFESQYKIMYGVFSVIITVLILVYLFSGIAKFIVVLIYSLIIITCLVFLPNYQQPIIVIGTLAFILNPLANLETSIEKALNDEDVLPLRISIRGKYWPFYSYRQEMKNYIRFPQTKKLFTKAWYLRLRQILTLALLFAAIYLFINELQNIWIDLTNYNLQQIFIFYGVISLFTMTFILFKKGFTALFHVAIMFVFAPIIYVIYLTPLDIWSKVIFSSIVLVTGVADIIYEKFASLKRVAYQSYAYYDSSMQRFVHANGLYEPLVYNETYNLVGIYQFQGSIDKFNREFNEILYYANRKHFIITAYTYNSKDIIIYTEFFQRHVRKAKQFTNYLETIFKTKVHEQIVYDKQKQIYEQTFFHKPEYIVTRALVLADMLGELQVDTKEVIISLIFSFESLRDIEAMSQLYYTERLEELDDEGYFAARIIVKTTHSNFMIENKVRDVLLNAMIHRGQYVRILVYYEGDR